VGKPFGKQPLESMRRRQEDSVMMMEDGTGSGSCPVAGCGINSVELECSAATVFVCLFL